MQQAGEFLKQVSLQLFGVFVLPRLGKCVTGVFCSGLILNFVSVSYLRQMLCPHHPRGLKVRVICWYLFVAEPVEV